MGINMNDFSRSVNGEVWNVEWDESMGVNGNITIIIQVQQLADIMEALDL